jgi:hypothetical protein
MDGVWGEGANRTLWWRQNPQPLTVTGRRLDADAPPLDVNVFDGYEGMSHQIAMLSFPTSGCWEVTGESGDTSLTFVVDVVAYEETVAYQREQARNADAEADRQEQMPFPVPDTCPATTWLGPDSLNIGVPTARYRLEGDGLTLGQDIGLLFEGQNTVYWIAGPNVPLADAVRGAIAVTSTHALDPEAEIQLEIGSQLTVATGFAEEGMWRAWSSTVTFPSPGCWTLSASIGPHSLDTVVYVYPRHNDDGVPEPTVVDTTPGRAPASRGSRRNRRTERVTSHWPIRACSRCWSRRRATTPPARSRSGTMARNRSVGWSRSNGTRPSRSRASGSLPTRTAPWMVCRRIGWRRTEPPTQT